MLKALREAKENTSWANQNEQYESAVREFVNDVLNSQPFRESFVPFHQVVSHFGMLNSLSQILIKLTAPGVPDFYQGNELWEFNLVDPDNRRAVDYDVRRRTLRDLQQLDTKAWEERKAGIRGLVESMHDGCIKLYVTAKSLNFRKQHPGLFQHGEYLPLQVEGEFHRHVVAFARKYEDEMLVVATPRLCAQLLKGTPGLPLGKEVWGDTTIHLPGAGTLHNIFTGEVINSTQAEGPKTVSAADLFRSFPVALLMSGETG
jgi:(1->4)-alpha-D-glucan 1-alpha-D-glucosylmutase